MPTIFVTFPPAARKNYYPDDVLVRLRTLGEVRLNPMERALGTAELIEAVGRNEIIVADRETAGTADLFSNLPGLVAFTRCAIDIRNIDVAAASANGVLITQASAGFVASVSEWIVGAMIDLARGISTAVECYRAGNVATPAMGRELKGSTLGVIGYGRIGANLCELGLCFGMQVLAADPKANVVDSRVEQVDMTQLLAESDFVVCLAPATAETENLMDAKAFASMKPGSFFINASRGELVDEHALEDALDAGRVAGCALDVGRAPDQMPSPTLARHPRVLATPHIGGLTPAAVRHQALETVAQIAEILHGRAPAGSVNADHAVRLARLRRD